MIGQPEILWPVTPDAAEHDRRSIYQLRRRTFQVPAMEMFDQPDGTQTCPLRHESISTPQTLAMLNSEFIAAAPDSFRLLA